MSSNSIETYQLTGTNSERIIKHALETLRPHLPVCLPIYRRLQFGRFFDATTLLTNVPIDSLPPENGPWLFAFVDRSCRPETEVWLLGSWEADNPTSFSTETMDNLITELVRTMKNLGIPTSIHQDVLDAQVKNLKIEKDSVGFSRRDYGGHAANPNIMLWGSTHEKTVPILDRLGFLSRKFKTAVVPNHTFIWDVDALPPLKDLPEGLRWGELRREHFAQVRSRTQIPRQDRTLAVLPNLGIFTEKSGELVAWAFVGLDASLTTLHVEEAWRGKGLAKAVTTKLFREKMGMFWEEGLPRLAHGFVIVGNQESAGMCRSLGGRSDWEVYWLRVDLGAL